MSGMHDQHVDNLPVPPLGFDQGKFTYASRMRRRNRRYAAAAALSILAVATGFVMASFPGNANGGCHMPGGASTRTPYRRRPYPFALETWTLLR
jgi:hypothetical protein